MVRFMIMRFFFLFLCIFPYAVKADHYYGGYITYKHISGQTYEVTLVTYADNDKENSDRDSVDVIWGDGVKEYIQRVNNLGNGETVFPGIKKNIYKGIHTYEDFGNYQLVFIDDFRPLDIDNIAQGKSGSTLLYFDAIIPVHDITKFCKNNAPGFLTEPFMTGLEGQPFRLSLTHYDIDGDSLSFKLVDPKVRKDVAVPGYYKPNGVKIDAKTGLFSWEFAEAGRYVFAYEIEEYRNNQLIGSSIADFPVFISDDVKGKGGFSTIEGVNDNAYLFDGPELINVNIAYENDEADSVFIEVYHALNTHFSVSENTVSNGQQAFDSLTINYFGNDYAQGNHIVTFRAGNIYGSDTIFDYSSFILSTASDTTWGCSVPKDLKDVVEITPIVKQFDVTPNLFDNSVWINVGEDYENIQVEVFDLRGRLVSKEENPEAQTFKMELTTLRSGMYFFRLLRKDKLLTVIRSVKK